MITIQEQLQTAMNFLHIADSTQSQYKNLSKWMIYGGVASGLRSIADELDGMAQDERHKSKLKGS